MIRPILTALVLVPILMFIGCAGAVKNMQPITVDQVQITPDPGKAMVIFMRPSTLGFGIQSSVFELNDNNEPELLGIVAAKKKIAAQIEPGEKLFMVIGESADFMSGMLDAGKTYYALVTPRMGWWKARFSLKPIDEETYNSSKFSEWFEACEEWVQKNEDSEFWASDNMPSIKDKRLEYYPKWRDRKESEKPRLLYGR